MVSFDVMLPFPMVPIKETMDLLRRHFEEDILGLFHHVLTTSYFTFNGQYYGQTDGVAMGSPLSPVIANFYMEDYEKAGLKLASLKPCCWFHYVDDTFVKWPHCPDKLNVFLHHLNSISSAWKPKVKATTSSWTQIFTELMALWDTNCTTSTHTNLYLNTKSHRHSSNKQTILFTLMHKGRTLWD
jgi:hypothetical protein